MMINQRRRRPAFCSRNCALFLLAALSCVCFFLFYMAHIRHSEEVSQVAFREGLSTLLQPMQGAIHPDEANIPISFDQTNANLLVENVVGIPPGHDKLSDGFGPFSPSQPSVDAIQDLPSTHQSDAENGKKSQPDYERLESLQDKEKSSHNLEPIDIVLECNGEKKTLADFTVSTAPEWLQQSNEKCDTLAACLWYGCEEECRDNKKISSLPIKGKGDSLWTALSAFDANGSISITAPSGGSMVVAAGNEIGSPITLAPTTNRGASIAPVDIIATFTSLPGRLSHTKDTIMSLKAQTLPPKVIVVSVPITSGRKENRGDYVIPNFLLNTPGVCVLRTPIDFGPATKLMGLAKQLYKDGLIREHGEAIHAKHTKHSRMRIVVVDDDTWYPPRMIEALFRWSMRLPNAVIAQHGWVPSVGLNYKGGKRRPEEFPLHYWGRHLEEPRPVSVVTGNTGYMLQPRHLDSLFWEGLERSDEAAQQQKGRAYGLGHSDNSRANELAYDSEFYKIASNSAKYMDDVWISGHFSRKNILKFAVPMDKNEDRARWSGGGNGPSLDAVGGVSRGDMNEHALKEFKGLWDVLRCDRPAVASSLRKKQSVASVARNARGPERRNRGSSKKLLMSLPPHKRASMVDGTSKVVPLGSKCYGPLLLKYRCCFPFHETKPLVSGNLSLEQYIQL